VVDSLRVRKRAEGVDERPRDNPGKDHLLVLVSYRPQQTEVPVQARGNGNSPKREQAQVAERKGAAANVHMRDGVQDNEHASERGLHQSVDILGSHQPEPARCLGLD